MLLHKFHFDLDIRISYILSQHTILLNLLGVSGFHTYILLNPIQLTQVIFYMEKRARRCTGKHLKRASFLSVFCFRSSFALFSTKQITLLYVTGQYI